MATLNPAIESLPIPKWEVITPETAARWLACNKNNRNLRPRHAESLARDMRDGNWRKSGDPIRFNRAGVLQDGQHRLHACVIAGVAFISLVIHGLDDDVYEVLDSGMKRTMGDHLSRIGVRNANNVAGSARATVKYRKGWLRSPEYPTHEEVLDFLHANQNFDEIIAFVCGKKMVRKFMPPSMAGWLYFEFYERDPALAQHMFSELESPSPTTHAGDPVMLLRDRLARNRMDTGKVSHLVLAAYVVKTWNALYTGSGMKLLRWTVNDEFPVIEPERLP